MPKLEKYHFYPLWYLPSSLRKNPDWSLNPTQVFYIQNIGTNATGSEIIIGCIYDLETKRMGKSYAYRIQNLSPIIIKAVSLTNGRALVFVSDVSQKFCQVYFDLGQKVKTKLISLQNDIQKKCRLIDSFPEGNNIYYALSKWSKTPKFYRFIKVNNNRFNTILCETSTGSCNITQHMFKHLRRNKNDIKQDYQNMLRTRYQTIIDEHKQDIASWQQATKAYTILEKKCQKLNRKYSYKRLGSIPVYYVYTIIALGVLLTVGLGLFFS